MHEDDDHWAGSDDASLLERVAGGDEEAFVAFYRRHAHEVQAFALAIGKSRSSAQDATQDVFLNVLENAARFDAAKGTARAWLYGCARHVILDRLRHDRRWSNEPPDEVVPCAGEDCMHAEQRLERLRAAIARLPTRVPRGARAVRSAGVVVRRSGGGAALPDRHRTLSLAPGADFARGVARYGRRTHCRADDRGAEVLGLGPSSARFESQRGVLMTQGRNDYGRLDADLAALRSALRGMASRADSEAALRQAFREHAARSGRARSLGARGRPSQWGAPRWNGLAAAIGVVAVGLLVAVAVRAFLGAEQARLVAVVAADSAGKGLEPATGRAEMLATFKPLLYGPAISPSAAYSVVRVRIPLSSLAIHAVGTDGTIEADVLVGEDGLASGIRFDTASTLLTAAGAEGPRACRDAEAQPNIGDQDRRGTCSNDESDSRF